MPLLGSLEEFSRKFTNLYITELSLVAFLTVLGQILIQNFLNEQLTDSQIINLAGKQRVLCQSLAKDALYLLNDSLPEQKKLHLTELKSTLEQWQEVNLLLKQGWIAPKTPVRKINSARVNRLLNRIEPIFREIWSSGYSVTEQESASSPLLNKASIRNLNRVLMLENRFLTNMDIIEKQYVNEALDRVNALRAIEIMLAFITVLVLFLEGVFVFKPASDQMIYTLYKLLRSEEKTKRVNEELIFTNKALVETEQKLLEATREKYLQQLNEERIRSASIIEGQEEERKRLAQDLHDGLGQMLTIIKLTAGKLDQGNNFTQKQQSDFKEMQEMIVNTIAETRAISFNLMPSVLNDFGLDSALRLLCKQLSANSGIHIHFQSNMEEERLEKNIEIGLFRIVQEALNNAVKHSGSTKIWVISSYSYPRLSISIEDDGVGFKFRKTSIKKKHAETGNGLYNMHSRAQLMNATLRVLSAPDKGTKINLKLSVKKMS